MRSSTFSFVVVAAAVSVLTACGGSADDADSVPVVREAGGFYRSTQLCVTNDTKHSQNLKWIIFDTNDQKTTLRRGDTACGEGTFVWEKGDVQLEIWQNSDRGTAWNVDVEIVAENDSLSDPGAYVRTIGTDGKPNFDPGTTALFRNYLYYRVGDTRTFTYTPLGGVTPVTVTMTRLADTDWIEMRATLS